MKQTKKESSHMTIYLYNKNKSIFATAEYDNITGSVVVKSGSKVSNDISKAPTFRNKKAIENRRKGKLKGNILIEDICFNSLSTAATFVYGGSRNGWVTWKDKDGNTMYSLFHKEK